jgi:hypothetical protein
MLSPDRRPYGTWQGLARQESLQPPGRTSPESEFLLRPALSEPRPLVRSTQRKLAGGRPPSCLLRPPQYPRYTNRILGIKIRMRAGLPGDPDAAEGVPSPGSLLSPGKISVTAAAGAISPGRARLESVDFNVFMESANTQNNSSCSTMSLPNKTDPLQQP